MNDFPVSRLSLEEEGEGDWMMEMEMGSVD